MSHPGQDVDDLTLARARRGRVAGARQKNAPPRPWLRRFIAVGVAAAAIAAALAIVLLGRSGSGHAAAARRQTVALSGRAVAVLEAGAALSWRRSWAGIAVEQPRGDVFYRVDRGGPFQVRTPAGTVVVTGTCFRVVVRTGRAADAAAPVSVLVLVYEGRVTLANASGGIDLAAGERGEARPQEPPQARPLPGDPGEGGPSTAPGP